MDFWQKLAEWYNADHDYEVPKPQQEQCRQEIFWRFELNPKLAKRVDADLQRKPNWDDIQLYTDNELFDNKFTQGFNEPANRDFPYYGISPSDLERVDSSPVAESKYLPLLPTEYQADYAHTTLHRLEHYQAIFSTNYNTPIMPMAVSLALKNSSICAIFPKN